MRVLKRALGILGAVAKMLEEPFKTSRDAK